MENNSTNNKINWFSIASIWFGGVVCIPALFIGSTIIKSQTFVSTLLAGFIGFSCVVCYMILLSIVGIKKQKATVSLAATSFGKYGANIIVGLVIGLSTVGWFAVQCNIAGASFSNIIKTLTGTDFPSWISSIFWGLIMLSTAVFGFKYLKWLNYIAVPSIIILISYTMFITFQNHSFIEITSYQPKAEKELSFLGAIGLAIGFIAVGGVIAPDYNRFAKNKNHAIIGSIIGVIPPAIILLGVGAILSITKGNYDIIQVLSTLGYPLIAMSILILTSWTTNVINIYSAGLAFTNVFNLTEVKRPKTTLIIGIIAVIVGALELINYFQEFIQFLTIIVPPIAGVIIADFFMIKSNIPKIINYNWTGILSWFLGASVIYLYDHDLEYIFGIIVAALCYVLFHRIQSTSTKLKHINKLKNTHKKM